VKTVLSFVILVSGIASQLAPGQDVSDQAKSFAALRFVLDVGQEVRVKDDTGHSMKGKVVAITETQLVVSHKGFFRSRVEKASQGRPGKSYLLTVVTAGGHCL
jgi:hypothetical protein